MLVNEPRAKAIMDRHGLDVLIATTPENVAYLTGYWTIISLRHRLWDAFAVVFKDDMAPDLVVSRGMADNALLHDCWVRDYHLFGEFFYTTEGTDAGNWDDETRKIMDFMGGKRSHASPLDALLHCLKERGAEGARIGVDEVGDGLFLDRVLEQRLVGVTTQPAYDIFREIRMVKTPAEVERIRRSVAVDEQAIHDALGVIGEGVSERAVVSAFMESVARGGGFCGLVCIGTGPRGCLPNVETPERLDRAIKKGDIIRFDVGCVVDAYHSDLARTAVLGKPSPKIQTYHDALMFGEEKMMEALRPGVTTGRLFELAVDEVRARGIPHYRRHHCGHGNGIEGYDLPQIKPGTETELEPGMVLCVETPYYEAGLGGLQIEDVVLITEDGYERISQIERKLFVL